MVSTIDTLGPIAQQIANGVPANGRYLIAIAGPPGAGKSTLAAQLGDHLKREGLPTQIVPMDGFHLSNEILKQRKLLHRKGAPQTFDADGFVHLIQRLVQQDEDVSVPVFDRANDRVLEDGDTVRTADRVLLVEGNYLLLKQKPWAALQAFWNETVFINPGLPILEERLIDRWRHHGMDEEAARKRAYSNDIPNAQHVLKHSYPPGIHIKCWDQKPSG